MSRRTHACLTCPGGTRHDNRVCAACRSRGITSRGGVLVVPLELSVFPSWDSIDDGRTADHYPGRYA